MPEENGSRKQRLAEIKKDLDDLRNLHPSFWEEPSEFLHWQFLRRNSKYRKRVSALYKKHPKVFAQRSRHLGDYPPRPKETFSRWALRVHQDTGIVRTHSDAEKKIKELIRLRVDRLVKKASRLIPIHPDVQFPHPRALESLSPLGMPVSVSTLPAPGMVKVNLTKVGRPKHLYFYPTASLPVVLRDVRWYCECFGLPRLFAQRVFVEVRSRFRKLKKQRIKKKNSMPIAVFELAAFDLDEEGCVPREIAEILLNSKGPAYRQDPITMSGKRTKSLELVRFYVKSAKNKILLLL